MWEAGVEPASRPWQGRTLCPSKLFPRESFKWARQDLNLRPPASETGALFGLSYWPVIWWNARDSHPALLLARQVCRSQHLQPTLYGNLIRVERIELSPRVPKTRMLALHHTRKGNEEG